MKTFVILWSSFLPPLAGPWPSFPDHSALYHFIWFAFLFPTHCISPPRAFGKCIVHRSLWIFLPMSLPACLHKEGMNRHLALWFFGNAICYPDCTVCQSGNIVMTVSQSCTSCLPKNHLRQRFLKTQKAITIKGKRTDQLQSIKIKNFNSSIPSRVKR